MSRETDNQWAAKCPWWVNIVSDISKKRKKYRWNSPTPSRFGMPTMTGGSDILVCLCYFLLVIYFQILGIATLLLTSVVQKLFRKKVECKDNRELYWMFQVLSLLVAIMIPIVANHVTSQHFYAWDPFVMRKRFIFYSIDNKWSVSHISQHATDKDNAKGGDESIASLLNLISRFK